MREERSEGIVLKNIEYKAGERILTLFSLSFGILSIIIKKISPKNLNRYNLTSPLCKGEFLIYKKRSSLFSFQDGSIIDLNLPLRESLPLFESATSMIQSLLLSQPLEKKSPPLYRLFSSYLKNLTKVESPETLASSFQLKILKYEGLLSLSHLCQTCHKNKPTYLVHGEPFCSVCAPKKTTPFDTHEWHLLETLTLAKNFSSLIPLTLEETLKHKISALFMGVFLRGSLIKGGK